VTAVSNTSGGEASAAAANSQSQALAATLRKLASKAAEQAGGGLSLVFAAAPGDDSPNNAARLRAAAGFATPHAAREAAQMLLPQVRSAIGSGSQESLCALPSLGERAGAGLEILPLIFEGRAHGALVVGGPAEITAAQRIALDETIAYLSLLLDRADVAAQLDRARASATDPNARHDEQNEEILKLSEALFAQDIELLRSNEKLGKIEKLKNDFIEKMSRELRTPLNSIIEGIISVLTGENDAI